MGFSNILGSIKATLSGRSEPEYEATNNIQDTESASLLTPTEIFDETIQHQHSRYGATGEATDIEDDTPSIDAQEGVKHVEAITLVWSKDSLVLVYISILAVNLFNSLEQEITNILTIYVISDFSAAPLISTITIVALLLSGIFQLPIAKVLDLWGRAEGFAVMVMVTTLGLVLMATCQNVATYAAAQVFYRIGCSGMSYVLEVIIADTSSLQNRALAFAFTSSPSLATTFVGPVLAQAFHKYTGYRVAFACFAIITPMTSLPIWAIMYYNQLKAKKAGLLVNKPDERTMMQSFWHYTLEFDAIGVVLLGAGLVLFLLPFTLAGSEIEMWRSGPIVAMAVIGIVLITGFGIWEKIFAAKPFIPFHLLVSPTVTGASLLTLTLFVAYFCWDGYFNQYLQVVHGLTIADAGYISNIYGMGACLWAIVVGVLIRVSGRYKWLAWIAMPVQLLGGGMMIFFRQPNTHIGFVIMCQVLIAFSGGTMVICVQMAVMAVCEHGQIAALIALLTLFSAVGSAVGSSVSGAIWTSTLPKALLEKLPLEAKDSYMDIYKDINVALSYPIGTPIRTAIMEAYAMAQLRMCTVGTIILTSGFIWIYMWKDVKLSDVKQTKGIVL